MAGKGSKGIWQTNGIQPTKLRLSLIRLKSAARQAWQLGNGMSFWTLDPSCANVTTISSNVPSNYLVGFQKNSKNYKDKETRRTRTQKKAVANCIKQNAVGEVLKDAMSLSKVLGNVMEFGNFGKIISCARRCWGVAHPSQRSLIAPDPTNDTICCSQDETGWNSASNGRSQRIIWFRIGPWFECLPRKG